MGGAPPRRAHPDGAHLARSDTVGRPARILVEAHPHARVAGKPSDTPSLEPELDEDVDDQLLHPANMLGAAMGALAHRDDGIADELAGAVERDVPTAVHPDEVGTHRLRVHQHVTGIGVDTEGVDGWVLQQEEVVGFRASGNGPLEVPRLGVGNGAEPADPHGRGPVGTPRRAVRIARARRPSPGCSGCRRTTRGNGRRRPHPRRGGRSSWRPSPPSGWRSTRCRPVG